MSMSNWPTSPPAPMPIPGAGETRMPASEADTVETLQVEEITSTAGLEAIRPQWDELWSLGAGLLRKRAEIEPHSVGWAYSPTICFRPSDASVGEYAHPTECCGTGCPPVCLQQRHGRAAHATRPSQTAAIDFGAGACRPGRAQGTNGPSVRHGPA